MKLKKIKWYDKSKQCLNQALSSGVEVAFASPDNEQVSPFAYCKDYLQDAVQGFVHQKKKTIYGFSYNPEVHAPLCLEKTKLLVTNSNDFDFSFKVKNCLDFLNKFEKQLKIRPTKAYLCFNPPLKYIRPGVFLFEGSGRWMKSPPMVSLYSLLIRLGFGHNMELTHMETMEGIVKGKINAYQSVDGDRLKNAWNGIKRILEKGDRPIFKGKMKDNFPADIDVSCMHNNCGIVGFSSEYMKHKIPHWYV